MGATHRVWGRVARNETGWEVSGQSRQAVAAKLDLKQLRKIHREPETAPKSLLAAQVTHWWWGSQTQPKAT